MMLHSLLFSSGLLLFIKVVTGFLPASPDLRPIGTQKRHHLVLKDSWKKIGNCDDAPTWCTTRTVLGAVGFPQYPSNQPQPQEPQNNDNNQRKPTSTEEAGADDTLFSAETRQLLGLGKHPAANSEKWKIRLQLAKPVTWVPLSFLVMCGAAASGTYHAPWSSQQHPVLVLEDAVKALWTMILAGPFSEGFAQTINDWYDQEIDAINEPYRPIPSGAIQPTEVFEQLVFLFVGGLGLAYMLDLWATPQEDFPVVTLLATVGYIMSYIYSAPPLKLKQSGWVGALAICICYIAFPWLCGHAVFGRLETTQDFVLPLFYSLVGLGPAIINDFKSIEGDKRFGLNSIPVLYGVETAKWITITINDSVQLAMVGYLWLVLDDRLTAAILLTLMLPQVYLQKTLLLNDEIDPLNKDMKYIGLSQPFVVLGLLATAISVGNHHQLLLQ